MSCLNDTCKERAAHVTTPTVTATAHRHRDRIWTLTIARCPYCGKPHYHGGGDGDTPSFGHRGAHCINHSNNSRGYILIAEVVS